MRRKNWVKKTAWHVLIVMILIGLVPKVEAGFAPSAAVPLSPNDRIVDEGKVQKFLEAKMVKERLSELGFTSEEIQSRLGTLSDEQLHQLALQLDEIRVGADDGLGILVALLVIAILIVILLWLTGHRVMVK